MKQDMETYGIKTIDIIIKEALSKIRKGNHNSSDIDKNLKTATIKYTSKNIVNDFYIWLVKKGICQKNKNRVIFNKKGLAPYKNAINYALTSKLAGRYLLHFCTAYSLAKVSL